MSRRTGQMWHMGGCVAQGICRSLFCVLKIAVLSIKHLETQWQVRKEDSLTWIAEPSCDSSANQDRHTRRLNKADLSIGENLLCALQDYRPPSKVTSSRFQCI